MLEMIAKRPRVVIADADRSNQDWLAGSLGERYEIVCVDSGAAAARELQAAPTHVLIVGVSLTDMSGSRLMAEVRAHDQGGQISMFLAESEQGTRESTEDDNSVFYVLNRSVAPEDINALVTSAAEQAEQSDGHVHGAQHATQLQRVLEVSRRLAMQRDLEGAARVAMTAVLEFADAERAYCLFHDAASGALWSEIPRGADSDEAVASLGIVGFVARTGTPVCVNRVDEDPRCNRQVDDPKGKGDERLLAHPVHGPDGQVHAVLIAVRHGNRARFDDNVQAMIASLAEQIGPVLHQLALHVEADGVLEEDAKARGQDLFRREAMEAHQSHRKHGDVVRISPAWVSWSYWVLLLLLIVGGTYLYVGRVDDYSSGPAVIRTTGRTEVTAKRAGTIMKTEVVPGQRVSEGQILARFYNADEIAEVQRLEKEFELQLVKFLRNPSSPEAGRTLASMRVQRDRAKARLEQRVARAPSDGVVSDLRIRPGQHLQPGDVILSLVSDTADMSVIVLLPGSDRPQLRPGMTLRLELRGYRYAYQTLVIESVSDDVVGPSAARRYLGSRLADTLPIRGPVVLVKAKLPRRTFEADGETYYYHDGMQAVGEVRVRSERIITTLIPGLKKL